METYLVYFDETGDDGVTTSSCDHFVLTSIYMSADAWKDNYDKLMYMRRCLKDKFGFYISEEMHTKHFLSNKEPYRKYDWSNDDKKEILKIFTTCFAEMNMSVVNVIIDKTKFVNNQYPVLEKALTYNIQRIENDSCNRWKYIVFSDKGRVGTMCKTARKIRAFNPIPSSFGIGYSNHPIQNLIEDILEKDSKESFFIQACDFISYFVHLYFVTYIQHKPLPNRVGQLIDTQFIGSVLATLKAGGVINLKANPSSHYGLVIYPK